ncbi:hypothetical protein V6N13_010230 [Hibiscus sabdariffa]|uniref:Uncharacterized protein n=1 Tax=Hibiscus sabdariffa TaxID=183260 RepID=A0ABR2PQC1_9ROSI
MLTLCASTFELKDLKSSHGNLSGDIKPYLTWFENKNLWTLPLNQKSIDTSTLYHQTKYLTVIRTSSNKPRTLTSSLRVSWNLLVQHPTSKPRP